MESAAEHRSDADSSWLSVGKRQIELRHPGKVLFPASGLTKQDLATYYSRVARWMLPHLRGRPLTLQRYPDGIGEPGFFQKEASDHFPGWLRTVEVPKEEGVVHHVVADSAATLVYLATQATITLHVWSSRADRPRRPDRVIFDLDPPAARRPADSEIDTLHRAARGLRRLLEDELALESFLMTTGSRGYHVLVPIARRYDFEEVRGFARDLARVLVAREPERLTVEQRKAKRGRRILVDVLRNGYAQTAVAPYSVRALPGAPVATPIGWPELGDTSPRRFDLANIRQRLDAEGDPLRAALDLRQRLERPAKRLAKLAP